MGERKSLQNENQFYQYNLTNIGEKNLADLLIKIVNFDKIAEKNRADPSEISPALERKFLNIDKIDQKLAVCRKKQYNTIIYFIQQLL